MVALRAYGEQAKNNGADFNDAFQYLESGLTDPSPATKRAAVISAGELDTARGRALLETAYGNSPALADRAVIVPAAAKAGSADILKQALADESLRIPALLALPDLGEPAIPLLAAYL
jgi:hypothetical protein